VSGSQRVTPSTRCDPSVGCAPFAEPRRLGVPRAPGPSHQTNLEGDTGPRSHVPWDRIPAASIIARGPAEYVHSTVRSATWPGGSRSALATHPKNHAFFRNAAPDGHFRGFWWVATLRYPPVAVGSGYSPGESLRPPAGRGRLRENGRLATFAQAAALCLPGRKGVPVGTPFRPVAAVYLPTCGRPAQKFRATSGPTGP
jgi:hypothetical protein